MGGKDAEFGFGHTGIQMLIRFPRGDVQQAAECLSLELRGDSGIRTSLGKWQGIAE